MSACSPLTTESVVTPALPSAVPSAGLAVTTPIDPVIVPGWAKIVSAAIEM